MAAGAHVGLGELRGGKSSASVVGHELYELAWSEEQRLGVSVEDGTIMAMI